MNERHVLFYVQHLLGIGHLRRAAVLARAIAATGVRTTLVSGGHPVPGLDLGDAHLEQLPPVRAVDLYFKELVDEHERPIDEAWKADRRDRLLQIWRATRPQVILIELFPFGRRQMRFELLPLLDEATGLAADAGRPRIVCSVRDILVAQKKPERNDEMLATCRHYFDHVLVHGDANFIPLDRTFPHAGAIADRLIYTGYAVDHAPGATVARGTDGTDEVIVSAGGGAVGEALLRAAIAAKPLTQARDAVWRVLVGVSVSPAVFEDLRRSAGPGIIVERARPDFTGLLHRCRLSISQGGYNTLMELLFARSRAVVVPYAGGIETEQTLRTRLLAERGLLQMVGEAGLTPAGLAAACNRALAAPPPPADLPIDTSGTPRTAALIADWARTAAWA